MTQENSEDQITSKGANTSPVPSREIALRDATPTNAIITKRTSHQNEPMTHERIVSMIEERRFDDLYELVSQGKTVLSNDDDHRREFLLGDIAQEGGFAAYRVIQFLISDGGTMGDPYHRSMVLRMGAGRGDVGLLEAVCSKGWHRLTDFYCILSSSCEQENEAIPVLTWLQKNRKKYFQNIVPKETDSIEIAFGDALSNELIRTAQFIIDNKKDLGFENWTPDQVEIIMSTADEGATKSLDYLSSIWGHDFVIGIVKEYMNTDNFELYYFEKTELWLKTRSRTLIKKVIKKHLQKAIERLDTVKQTLQEGDYIMIVNHMAKAYDACTHFETND